jgi:hypothetical protein
LLLVDDVKSPAERQVFEVLRGRLHGKQQPGALT